MFRLFHDNNIDFLGRKAVFMTISVALMLIGCVGVLTRGFNLGVDFAGGRLVRASFVDAPSPDAIRDALGEQGIDTNKVIIQSTGSAKSADNGRLIRLPQGSDPSGATEKRAVLNALAKFNTNTGAEVNKLNINAVDAAELAAEMSRLGADATVAADTSAQKIVAYRDAQPKGSFASMDAIRAVPDVPPAALDLVASGFYAGKVDINSTGSDDLLGVLKRYDPLGIKADPAASDQQYAAMRDAIVTYRDKTRDGVITSVDELPLDNFPPEAREALRQDFVVGNFNIVNDEYVGASVGEDLRNRAIYVTLASLVGMLIFIAFRFEWIYGVSAVLAVLHDVPICLGIFALFQWEVNITVVAALLTLIGYSVNDTIVIFDRIREMVRAHRRDSLAKVTNDAINQTLSRTVIASGTAFLTVLVLALFGGDVLKSFSLVLLIGIIVGTYSSIGVASPIMLWYHARYRPQRLRGGDATEAARATRGSASVGANRGAQPRAAKSI